MDSRSYVSVLQDLNYFKELYENKPFTLTHCWKDIKKCPKWEENLCFIDLEEGVQAQVAQEMVSVRFGQEATRPPKKNLSVMLHHLHCVVVFSC
jgi:hypothetical protein